MQDPLKEAEMLLSEQLGDALKMSVEQEQHAARIRKMIGSALRPRRTVRVTYYRSSNIFNVNLMIGDNVISNTVGTNKEDIAEGVAKRFSKYYGVDITRLDVP
jgi:hypothetical protein